MTQMTKTQQLAVMLVHLEGMTQRSMSPSGKNCVYRGPNGQRCLVGSLIPDRLYNPKWEGCAASGLEGFGDPKWLDACQREHDNCKGRGPSWRAQVVDGLREAAAEHAVEWPTDSDLAEARVWLETVNLERGPQGVKL